MDTSQPITRPPDPQVFRARPRPNNGRGTIPVSSTQAVPDAKAAEDLAGALATRLAGLDDRQRAEVLASIVAVLDRTTAPRRARPKQPQRSGTIRTLTDAEMKAVLREAAHYGRDP